MNTEYNLFTQLVKDLDGRRDNIKESIRRYEPQLEDEDENTSDFAQFQIYRYQGQLEVLKSLRISYIRSAQKYK